MSLQAQLNNHAISMLPIVEDAIKNAKDFEKNQMYDKALREINNSIKPISEMSEIELQAFQARTIKIFKHHNWM